MTDGQKWSISYTDVSNKKTVESFDSKGEAQSRYEALIPRTYGDLGDLIEVTVPVQSALKVQESVSPEMNWGDFDNVVKRVLLADEDKDNVKGSTYRSVPVLGKGGSSVHICTLDDDTPLFTIWPDYSNDSRGHVYVYNNNLDPAIFKKVCSRIIELCWKVEKALSGNYDYPLTFHPFSSIEAMNKYFLESDDLEEECGGASAASLGVVPTGVVGRKSESPKNEDLTDKEEHEWYRFWFDEVKKRIVPGKSGSVEHNCKMLPYSDVRQMWGVAAMAKELCDNFRRYLSYRGYTNSKGSPFAEISWRAEDAGDLLAAMNKADGTPIESKKNESGGADLASVYGSGDIITHESSADGFYVDDHDPMGWAILNNDVDTMKELFAGTAPTPNKPWLYAGWDEYTDAPADKDGSYPYRYSWDSERDLNFVEDWKRVVGETNNEEALNLLLEHVPDFIPTAIDFYNAFLAGYDKKLLRKLLDNIRAVWDKDDINDSYLNYGDFGETPYENLIEFLGE